MTHTSGRLAYARTTCDRQRDRKCSPRATIRMRSQRSRACRPTPCADFSSSATEASGIRHAAPPPGPSCEPSLTGARATYEAHRRVGGTAVLACGHRTVRAYAQCDCAPTALAGGSHDLDATAVLARRDDQRSRVSARRALSRKRSRPPSRRRPLLPRPPTARHRQRFVDRQRRAHAGRRRDRAFDGALARRERRARAQRVHRDLAVRRQRLLYPYAKAATTARSTRTFRATAGS